MPGFIFNKLSFFIHCKNSHFPAFSAMPYFYFWKNPELNDLSGKMGKCVDMDFKKIKIVVQMIMQR